MLPRLYERVVVPTAVVNELAEGGRCGHNAPSPAALPWADVCDAPGAAILPLVTDLGDGERAAIALASSRKSDLLILGRSRGWLTGQRIGSWHLRPARGSGRPHQTAGPAISRTRSA
ncbi:MAG: hypothetical protein IPJ34_26035 [Myxococcales bacterium]|nr:hypothetical protein [Myxococcales bacterium]